MHNDETGKPEDLISEDLAIRRGMTYSKDRHDKVCRAEIEAPLLIDQLYNHEIIAADHHFYGRANALICQGNRGERVRGMKHPNRL